MTPQFIMRCGISDYLKGLCDGQGNYVRQSPTTMAAPYYDNLEYQTRQANNEVEYLGWYEGYANGDSCGPKGILVANWNHVSRRTQKLLEQYGYELDWDDELVGCDHCNKAAHISQQYYGDLHTAHIDDNGGVLCAHCAINEFPEDIIEAAVNNPRSAVKYSSIDLSQYGYVRQNTDSYENGFHPGQTDNPKAIYKALREKHGDSIDIVFQIDGAGQFDVAFSVWTRPSDYDEVNDLWDCLMRRSARSILWDAYSAVEESNPEAAEFIYNHMEREVPRAASE